MDLARRDEYEQDLARALGRTLRQQFNKFMAALGDSPSLDKLTPALYEDLRAELQATIRPRLEKIYIEHAEALTNEFPQQLKARGIGIDWGLVNERAAEWASQYSFDLVTGVTSTTRKTLQRQIADFFRDSRKLSDLRATLTKLFGPVRAEMIAQTEVTRAASAAEMMYEHELNKLGLNTTQVWVTNNDEIVQRCPICWPRHNTQRGEGWDEPPPGHPRCRC